MKILTLASIAAIAMIIGSGAYAYDYVLTVEPRDDDKWAYTLTNNGLTANVVDWTLHWNPSDPDDDENEAVENFDVSDGVIKPLPVGWYKLSGDFPSFGIYYLFDMAKAIKPGGQLGGFTLKFKTRDDHTTKLPGWFTVGYVVDGQRMSTEMIPVPEPSSLCMLLGLVCGALARGTRSRKK